MKSSTNPYFWQGITLAMEVYVKRIERRDAASSAQSTQFLSPISSPQVSPQHRQSSLSFRRFIPSNSKSAFIPMNNIICGMRRFRGTAWDSHQAVVWLVDGANGKCSVEFRGKSPFSSLLQTIPIWSVYSSLYLALIVRGQCIFHQTPGINPLPNSLIDRIQLCARDACDKVSGQ